MEDPTRPEEQLVPTVAPEYGDSGVPQDLGIPELEETSFPPRRKRVQVGEWPVTLAMVGALVGLFVAGLLVALNQAFPEGSSGGMNGGVLTGVSIAIIAGASALGAVMAGVAPLVRWIWRRAKGSKVSPALGMREQG